MVGSWVVVVWVVWVMEERDGCHGGVAFDSFTCFRTEQILGVVESAAASCRYRRVKVRHYSEVEGER